MTTTLAHPANEELGRFVDGTLDDAGRATVVAHIADCDECRIVVVDSAEFVEPVVVHSDWRRWMAAAGVAVFITAGGFTAAYDPRPKLAETYGHLKNRPIEGRLVEFPYKPLPRVMRSPAEPDDPQAEALAWEMQDEAASVSSRERAIGVLIRSAKTFHAQGLGLLLSGKAEESLAPLRVAATKQPENLRYQCDLAVALIAARPAKTQNIQQAVDACDRALKVDPNSQDALFNRALALEKLDRTPEAIAGYRRYLAVDSTSGWADDARRNLDRLQPSLP